MIYITNTPNNAGVSIHGDYKDFNELYDALHEIVGDEYQYPNYEGARLRVLGVCYDIRHAFMGDRELEFVDNGMDQTVMKKQNTIAHCKNVYLVANAIWPEIMFVAMALNDFVLLYKKRSKHWEWDKSVTTVRKFQMGIAECIKDTVSDTSYKRMMNIMERGYAWYELYATQYLDLLNCRFLEMDKEKRLKNIPVMAKRIAEQGLEYMDIKSEVINASRRFNCDFEDVALNLDYPEDIDW